MQARLICMYDYKGAVAVWDELGLSFSLPSLLILLCLL